MTIDYRSLLLKYINHVGDSEGTTFLHDWNRTPFDIQRFTDEEWDELQKLNKEPEDEDGDRG